MAIEQDNIPELIYTHTNAKVATMYYPVLRNIQKVDNPALPPSPFSVEPTIGSPLTRPLGRLLLTVKEYGVYDRECQSTESEYGGLLTPLLYLTHVVYSGVRTYGVFGNFTIFCLSELPF